VKVVAKFFGYNISHYYRHFFKDVEIIYLIENSMCLHGDENSKIKETIDLPIYELLLDEAQ
jgi:hypothetical protein